MKAWILWAFLYALPFALRDLYLPQSSKKSINSEEENRDHAQIFSFSHLYPAVLCALQRAFPPISISDIFSSQNET